MSCLITVLKDEVVTAMQLAGLKSLEEADPAMLNTAELDILVSRSSSHPYARKHSGKRRQFHL